MMKRVAVVLMIGLVALAYQVIKPPPTKTCGSPGCPSITAPRVKLRDGRHLAYKEHGVSPKTAKYKIIYVHGSGLSKEDTMSLTYPSSKYFEDLGVHLVSFDRPGYGESDPDPKRTPKSLALDVEDLADNLGLGPKFYVIGFSMGGQAVWGILKYIPHRLAGAALLTPVVNYWWSGLASNLSAEAYYHKQLPQDRWAVRVAHYVPWLTYWWNTQTLFPASSVSSGNSEYCNPKDLELISKANGFTTSESTAFQQGLYESVFRDFNVGFGTWEFDPMDLENLFPEGSVHLWQGEDDRLVPTSLQRHIAQRLKWIHYHELPGFGHLFLLNPGMGETIVRTLLLGHQ